MATHHLSAPGHEDEGASAPSSGADAVLRAISADDNPGGFERVAEEELADDDAPINIEIAKTRVTLPAGIMLPDGEILQSVSVRELTGYDEEKLARSQAKNQADYMTELLTLGIDTSDIDRDYLPVIIDGLLLGDRDAILMGMRTATYGPTLSMRDMTCPQCDESFDFDINLDKEVKVRTLDNPRDRMVKVATRRYGECVVRFAQHGDMVVLYERKLSGAEMDTMILSRCLLQIGEHRLDDIGDDATQLVRALGLGDREKILTSITDAQPGPQLQGVTVACPACNFSAPAGLTLAALFRRYT
jgi:hypothetical protein